MTTTIGSAFDSWWQLLAIWHGTADVEDAQMYAALRAQSPGPAVELGIGDGRLASLVRPEYSVDLSTIMLAKCRERMGEETPLLLQENFTSFQLPEAVQFTYSPLNTLNHVPADEREAVFRNVFEQTQPGGRFVFDSRVVSDERLRAANRVPSLGSRTREHVIYQTASVLDWTTMHMQLDASIEYLDEQGRVREKRYFEPMPFWNGHPEQFRTVAERTGWVVEDVWGDFRQGAFTASSKIQVWMRNRPV